MKVGLKMFGLFPNFFSLFAATTSDTTDELTKATTVKVNALTKYWQSIDWDGIVSLLISKGITLILLSIFIIVLRRIGMRLIKKSFDNYSKKEAFSQSRIRTLYTLSSNLFQYTLFFIFLYSLLTLLGIPIGSLIAGAGIAGVAIGLGAQGFINDLITGFFIILERQIDVGDYVKIGAVEGNVVSVGLRTTQLKSLDGTLHFLPNRTISLISNLSRSNMRVLIDLRINGNTDLEKVKEIIEAVNQRLTPKYKEIQSGPTVIGLVDTGNGNFAYRIILYTLNGSQTDIQVAFLSEYIEALHKEGIELPQSPLNFTTN